MTSGQRAVAKDETSPSTVELCGGIVLLDHPEPGIGVITMNRPKARNALSLEMLAAMSEALDLISQDDSVRAVVVAGNGPAFCAGHDLKELTARRSDDDGGKSFYVETMTACSALMMKIVHCDKPVIASVHAMATAAGCQLVATCDLAVAADTAKFCTPGVNIGLFCSTPMVALSRNVSRKRAMEMLLLGELISAEDAADFGLVNRAVAPEAVRDEAIDMARRIAAKSSKTVAIGKSAFYSQIEKSLAGAYQETAEVMVHNMMERDAKEGIGAFLEKREPKWDNT
ncbi:MAG: enoyl-CoA hydratase [Hyphomicrobiaceae bacterium]